MPLALLFNWGNQDHETITVDKQVPHDICPSCAAKTEVAARKPSRMTVEGEGEGVPGQPGEIHPNNSKFSEDCRVITA